MTTYYLDSSAVVKMYVAEIGSDWLRSLLFGSQPTTYAVSSHLLCVEVWSAFARRLREGSVTSSQYTRMNAWFLQHRHEFYRLKAVDEEVIQKTRGLFGCYALHAYDAIHLATATLANQQLLTNKKSGLTFLCTDDRLLAAAAAEGLAVDNPNDHP